MQETEIHTIKHSKTIMYIPLCEQVLTELVVYVDMYFLFMVCKFYQ